MEGVIFKPKSNAKSCKVNLLFFGPGFGAKSINPLVSCQL